MKGRAMLAMVASSTTISWAIEMRTSAHVEVELLALLGVPVRGDGLGVGEVGHESSFVVWWGVCCGAGWPRRARPAG